jgi:hypothetical protein
MDNPEKLATLGKQDIGRTNKNHGPRQSESAQGS